MVQHRPYVTVILAMSADGKIADLKRSPARFGSISDKAHLEKQIAASDAVLFGAGTLRAYGTTLTISHPQLLQNRVEIGKSLQPLHIVITESANFIPEIRFFKQPVRRWLITTTQGAIFWQQRQEFEKILIFEQQNNRKVNILAALEHLADVGIERLAVLGGGELVASMLELDLVDEFWLTVCPLVLGSAIAPTPVGGVGFSESLAPRLQLVEAIVTGNEVFLHYRVVKE
jgi:5-amino-6-(5-phosphoribosylamino)uracil reductase